MGLKMSIYEQIKALNKKEQKQMTGFIRKNLLRQRRIAKNQYEQENERKLKHEP